MSVWQAVRLGTGKNAEPVKANQAKGSIETDQPLIRLRSVVKAYHTAVGPLEALKGVDLDVYSGEFLAITGKSGSGKTTLINMITGTDHVTSGEVWVGDTCIHCLDESRLARWRGRTMGVVYQSFYLIPTLSLLDNILLPMDFRGLFQGRRSREYGMELLSQVELEEHAHKLPSQVSGGQQQRVAIARALANAPPIIVADEPTGRLDSVTAEVIFDIFQDFARRGKTVVMVTHDRGIVHRAGRTLEIRDGEVVT